MLKGYMVRESLATSAPKVKSSE